tara:strand:- start:3054 stop:3731 length:678 start_codon:yes stop_codon:yes gene_type:complete
MKFRNVLLAGALLGLATLPVKADPLKDSEYFTNHSMGCMLLQECTEGVAEIFSLLDVSTQYDEPERYTFASNEFNQMLVALNQVGVKVYLADQKYFPVGHRGVYHTVSNNFYLNRAYMGRPSTLMSVMRHEGWHAAQDCMAGTINNSMIAIIMNEEKVPMIWQEIATNTYKFQPGAIPWEKEAFWAGKTEGMTMSALQACARGNMWETYTPTPMTNEWLEKNGYK